MSHQGKRQPATGLVLTGGGARAAYQAGVLRAVVDILDAQAQSNFASPFDIICGTSAGAINAAAYACRADRPRLAVHRMCRLWATLNTSMIYRADAPGLIKTGVRWLSLLALGWMFSGLRNKRQSLLDNQPMADLLRRVLDFGKLKANLAHGHVSSLAITASGYTSGEHLTFYQSHDGTIAPWHRSLRMAVPAKIGIDHLMASSAIPFVFPARAVKVHGNIEWCGDGSIRQLAPISPAIHLGADRVLVIGTGYRDDTHPEKRQASPPYPTLAQVGGHAMSSIFLNSLSMDVERLERMNTLVEHVDMSHPSGPYLRKVNVLTITPSRSLDTLALEYLDEMPREVRTLFKVLGVSAEPGRAGGGTLMSYLLFESGYTQRLIELGYTDTMRRTEAVTGFFKEAQV